MLQPVLSPDTLQSFSDRLRAFRARCNLSPAELAGELRASASAVRRWEAGTACPTPAQAARLAQLGMDGITEADTDLRSRPRLTSAGGSRTRQAHAHRHSGRRPFRYAGRTWRVLPAPYVLNGPPDQTSFHDALLKMQMSPLRRPTLEPADYLDRLSLVSEVDGHETSQARLERARQTATSWSSNYGSHGWHRYVGRFPPHLVRALLNHFQASAADCVLDPFAGSGTTNVECRLLGVPSIGVEISPLSALLARTKCDLPKQTRPLLELADGLTSYYQDAWSAFTRRRKGALTAHRTVIKRPGNLISDFPNYERWLTPEALLGISIVAEYAAQLRSPRRDWLLVALSARMRSIGNVDVDVVRAEYRREPRRDVDVLRLVLAQIRKMASSIDAMHTSHPSAATQARTQIIENNVLDTALEDSSITHVITSPPYGVESLSYLRTHLLSFRCLEPFLDVDPYADGHGVIGSEYVNGHAPERDWQHAAVSSTFAEFFAKQVTRNDSNLARRTTMMMAFFDDMGRLAERLRRWMMPGGCIALVIGNKRLGDDVIPTHTMLTELFEANGFSSCSLMKHKLKTNNSNSQVPWQERIIQNEYILIMSRE